MKELVAVLLLLVASTAYGEIYTWKDARGTLFYTNSLYEIPARYRARAKLLDVATGKKLPIGTAQQPPPAGSAATQPSQIVNPLGAPPPTSSPQVPAQASSVPTSPGQSATPPTPAQTSPRLASPPGGTAQPQPGARRRARPHYSNRDE